VRGTRTMPDWVVNSHDIGESIEDIHEDWPSLSVTQMERLIEVLTVSYKGWAGLKNGELLRTAENGGI